MSRPVIRPARPEEAEAVAALINAINSLDGGAPALPMTAAVLRRDLLGPAPRAVLPVASTRAPASSPAGASTTPSARRMR